MRYMPILLVMVVLIVVAGIAAARPFSGPDRIALQNAAAGVLPAASVGEAELAAGAVTISKIGAGAVSNAQVKADAAIASSKLADNVVTKDSDRLLTEGYFDVVNTTQLVFIASGVTNVIDADITTP